MQFLHQIDALLNELMDSNAHEEERMNVNFAGLMKKEDHMVWLPQMNLIQILIKK